MGVKHVDTRRIISQKKKNCLSLTIGIPSLGQSNLPRDALLDQSTRNKYVVSAKKSPRRNRKERRGSAKNRLQKRTEKSRWGKKPPRDRKFLPF